MAQRPAYAIFEGGGAKGVAHVGALRAAEEQGLAFVGVAGASAGAIVATLVALGYDADHIMHPDRKDENILAVNGTTPTKILGEDLWEKFKAHCLYAEPMEERLSDDAGFWSRMCGLVNLYVLHRRLRTQEKDRGFFSTVPVEVFVNQIVRARLLELYAENNIDPSELPERVTFKHLNFRRFPKLLPLKIIVTDVEDEKLMVFDHRATPDVVVSEAVAASIAIPLFFKPAKIPSHKAGLFVDGGLVSNLPVWVFSEEKLEFERRAPKFGPIPIIGFSLTEDGEKAAQKPEPSLPKYIGGLVRTAIFGSQAVSARFIEDLLVVELATELGLVSFDAPWRDLCKAYSSAKDQAAKRLRSALFFKPERLRAVLAEIVETIEDGINARRRVDGRGEITQSRGNLVELFGARSLRVIHGVKMDADADDRLLLDGEGAGAAQAFRERNLIHMPLDPAQPIDLMTKYERALVRRSLKSAICTPIYPDLTYWRVEGGVDPQERRNTKEPLGVFCFDSDDDLSLDFKIPEIRDLIAEQSILLSVALESADPVKAE